MELKQVINEPLSNIFQNFLRKKNILILINYAAIRVFETAQLQ